MTSVDKMHALNRFSNTPIVNENVIKGNHSTLEAKRQIEISKDELNDIISYKEKLENDRAYSHFSNQIKNFYRRFISGTRKS